MQMRSSAVVFVAMGYPWGTIRHLALLGGALHSEKDRKYEVFVASLCPNCMAGSLKAICSEIPASNIIEAGTFEELVVRTLDLTKTYSCVVIHTGGGWGQTKGYVSALRHFDRRLASRVLLVGTTHSYRHDSWLRIPMSAFQYVLYRMFYRMIVFQSLYTADQFVGGKDLIRRGKGVVIPLGCEVFPDKTEVPPPVIVEKGLDSLLLDNRFFKFVYLAEFRPGKMHVWLVRAMAPVLRRHREARVLLCGAGNPGVIKETMGVIEQEGIQEQVVLPGKIPRDEVPWLLQHSNCGLVPSRAETFGHNFLEPMFAGLPVIGTSVGVGCDVIREKETGCVISLSDADSVARAMENLIENPAMAMRMGTNARALVEHTYRHSDVANQLTSLYERLIEEVQLKS